MVRKWFSDLYHSMRRQFYPEKYWTQEELDSATIEGHSTAAFFRDEPELPTCERVIVLSEEDFNAFIRALESPAEPNERLIAAYKRYRESKNTDD